MPLSLTKPTVGGDNGAWGTKLNTALDAITSFVNGLETSIAARVAKAGDTLSGLLNLNTVTQAHVHVASGSSVTLDLSTAQSFDLTVSGATTVTFANAPSTANALSGFLLRLVNGGSAAVTWPASVDWPGGTAPSLTPSGTDLLVFTSDDQGATWRGAVAISDAR